MNKIGLYGGSFDPVHNGHLITVNHVLEQRDLEKVFFIPTYISPFKVENQVTQDYHRVEMIKLIAASNPKFELSLFEIERKGISYTIDTIKHFKEQFDYIDLIIGYDNIQEFHKWKDPDEIFQLVNVIVMKRTTDELKTHNEYVNKAVFVDTPTIDISSTEIRERVKANKTIDFLVPEKVKDYILQNKLYVE